MTVTMRPTSYMKAVELVGAARATSAANAVWQTEHFTNGEHNSRFIPFTTIIVSSSGTTSYESSIKDVGASYSATVAYVSTGLYSITLDSAFTVLAAEAFVFTDSTPTQAQVDDISGNVVTVRTYTLDASGNFTLADSSFVLDVYADAFEQAIPASIPDGFAIGDYPDAAALNVTTAAQNEVFDLLTTRHTSAGVHNDKRVARAVARIEYAGSSTYSVLAGSEGVTSATFVATGKVTVTFDSTAPNAWDVTITPIGVAVYAHITARTTTSVTIELFSTAHTVSPGPPPTYANKNEDFFIVGRAL